MNRDTPCLPPNIHPILKSTASEPMTPPLRTPLHDPLGHRRGPRPHQPQDPVRRKPAVLFPGKHEAVLLRDRIGVNFAPDSVRCLRNHYSPGLGVIGLDIPVFLRTAGRKRVHDFRASHARNPLHSHLRSRRFWQFPLE